MSGWLGWGLVIAVFLIVGGAGMYFWDKGK